MLFVLKKVIPEKKNQKYGECVKVLNNIKKDCEQCSSSFSVTSSSVQKKRKLHIVFIKIKRRKKRKKEKEKSDLDQKLFFTP